MFFTNLLAVFLSSPNYSYAIASYHSSLCSSYIPEMADGL